MHGRQLGNEMIKNRRNNMSKAKDVNVISQRREKTRGKNLRRTTQSMKVGKKNERSNKRINLVHTNRQKEDKQIS